MWYWNLKSRNSLTWQSSRGGATKSPVFLSAPQSSPPLHLHLRLQLLLLRLQLLLLSKFFPGRLRSTTAHWGRGTRRHRLASLASRSKDSVQFLIKSTALWLNWHLACEGECSKASSNHGISFCSLSSCFHLKLDIKLMSRSTISQYLMLILLWSLALPSITLNIFVSKNIENHLKLSRWTISQFYTRGLYYFQKISFL